ncbi:MAG: PhzF family phenazine biosynthesis protein [Burkholderiaceae bacterium]
MKDRAFKQVDVFTDTRYRGNPLAVVLDGEDIEPARMAGFANWTNLSETTFLLPPTDAGADYRVRIFTPLRELPFAGHPTLGSCHAWLEAGGQPRQPDEIVQQCELGLIRVRRTGDGLAFAAPGFVRDGPLAEASVAQICRALGIARNDVLHHQWIDNGPGWQGVVLRSAAQVLALRPDVAALGDIKLGVIGAHPQGHDCAFEVRAFFGSVEDPVTGSLNAGFARWLIGAGLAPPSYVAAQGTALGRQGRVRIERDAAGDTWVGGQVVTCIDGQVTL